ncbi:DUF58 domain-containing protein [Streptosporangiaceae bacterium NEAU-GS5]|nr:DUF58 domain-containing protein [Streptosporangiaceae bacterium NEAU-GS5]
MLTRTGVMLAASAALWTALGIATKYPELVSAGAVCALMVVAALPWLRRLPHFDVELRLSAPYVMLGNPAQAVVTVRNRAGRRSPSIGTVALAGDHEIPFALPSVDPLGSRDISVSLPTDRRGAYVIGPTRIVRTDPLRLLLRQADYGGRGVLHVYPRMVAVSALATLPSDDEDGDASAFAPRGGVTFKELRPYVPGEDWRLIHWKSSARQGELMVRQNVVFDRPPHVIVLDVGVEPYAGDGFEDAVSVVASLCVAAARQGFPVEVRTSGGHRAAAARGRGGAVDVAGVLRLLCGVRQSSAGDLSATVAAARGAAVTGIVTGQLSARDLHGLSMALKGGRLTTVVCLTDLPEPSGKRLFGAYVPVRSVDEFAAHWNVLARA